MRARIFVIAVCTLTALSGAGSAAQEAARAPLTVSSVTVTLEGTSKKDPFFASTRTVRVDRLALAEPRAADALQQALQPGGLEALDISIPVRTLTSPDEGVDDHIRESLRGDSHPEIRFQLRSIEHAEDDPMGFPRVTAHGTLTIAGVAREVTLGVMALRTGRSLLLDIRTDLLMTDFGVTPPKGWLGTLRTDPLVHIRIYLRLVAADA